MGRRQQSCVVHGCDQPRWRYSEYRMCDGHDTEAQLRAQAELEETPKYRLSQKLEEAKTGADLKDVIRELIEEVM